MKGWKIHILGIGTEQAARELAQELSGKYSEVSSEPTSEELAAATKDFLGRVDLVEPPLISRLTAQGKGKITLKLASQGYQQQESVQLIISRILLTISSKEEKDILTGEYQFELEAEEAKEIKIPIKVPDPTVAENLESPHGRGILLMRAYMNLVEYNNTGNVIHIVKLNDEPDK